MYVKHSCFPSLSWPPKNFLRHFSLAEKFYFFFHHLWTFSLLWGVNGMHPTQHLSMYLSSGFSGATHMFTVNGTYVYVGGIVKGAQRRRAKNSTESRWELGI